MAKNENDGDTPATTATSATRGANEWGIPDWRDAAAYGDVKTWTHNRWRWEFYRRRDDLREYFDARADEVFQSNLADFSRDPSSFRFPEGRVRSPDEPGFCITVDLKTQPTWGYRVLGNPRIGPQPMTVIAPIDGDGRISLTYGNKPYTFGEALQTAKVQLEPLQEFILQHWKDRQGIKLAPHECAVTFDLTKPMEAQLETARDWLRAKQTALLGKPLQRRRHRGKWLAYLRTLDARAAGLSWAEITDAFYEQGLIDRRKNASGGYRAPDPQAARDMWLTADALRFNF